MDIQRWLRDTCARERERVVNPSRLPQRVVDLFPGQKRRRVSVASSHLGSESKSVVSTIQHNKGHVDTSSASSTSSSSSEDSSSTSEAPSDQYKRKPRHKTRADLYKPQSGSRKRRRKGNESKKKRQKTKYRKTKKLRKKQTSGRALVNNFNAKNVPKSRLTVRSFQIYLDTVMGHLHFVRFSSTQELH